MNKRYPNVDVGFLSGDAEWTCSSDDGDSMFIPNVGVYL
jgi:hypothetical protein